MALAAKVRDEELIVIDDLSFGEPKTKDMVSVLSHLDLKKGDSLLVTTDKHDANVYRMPGTLRACRWLQPRTSMRTRCLSRGGCW